MKKYRFAVHNMTTGHAFWFYKTFSSAYEADCWAMWVTFSNKNNHRYNIIPTFEREDDYMETINAIRAIIEEDANMKNSYFFTPPMAASARRSYERKHSHDTVTWTDSGHEYTARFEVVCSCRNVYARGYYSRDGKRTTLTAIKNSLQRLEAQQ